MKKATIYFGANIGTDGDTVSGPDWADFVREFIAPVFDGFTIVEALGYWRGNVELTRIVTIYDAHSFRVVNHIAEAYCDCFKQECVLVEWAECSIEYVEGKD